MHHTLSELETKAAAGAALTRADADRLMACADLISVGRVGEAARVSRSGDRVTFGRLAVVAGAPVPADVGDAHEVRLTGIPASLDEARAWTRAARAAAPALPLTGFTAAGLLALADHDHLALVDGARALRADGLDAVAELAVDEPASLDALVDLAAAIERSGLGLWRLTVAGTRGLDPLTRVARALAVHARVGGLRAFAPLARKEPVDAPSTGYDDVRAVALASAWARAIPAIQIEWPIHGPKLAQVAIAFGANDLDGIEPGDGVLGKRRSPLEEIQRQIRAAGGAPVERDGRYAVLA